MPLSVAIVTSFGSPSATCFLIRAEGPKESASVWPVARSNPAVSSSSDVFIAVVLMILISGTSLPTQALHSTGFCGVRPIFHVRICRGNDPTLR